MPLTRPYITNVDDEELVTAVKRRLPIFDKDDKNHCNRELIAKLWNDIATEICSDAVSCKTRWTSMRDYFVKKHKEMTDKNFQPKSNKVWAQYRSMSFLIPYITSHDVSINADNIIPDIGDTNDNDSTDGSEIMMIKPAVQQNNEIRKPEVYLGTKRKFEEESDTSHSLSSSVFHQDNQIGISEIHQRTKRTGDDDSIEAKLDLALLKVLKQPTENYHELFFKSLIPMVSRLDHLETVQFRAEVLEILLKYLKRQQSTEEQYG